MMEWQLGSRGSKKGGGSKGQCRYIVIGEW